MNKIVVIIIGGRSPERDVSIRGAGNLINLVEANDCRPVLIGIGASGTWFLQDTEKFKKGRTVLSKDIAVTFPPASGCMLYDGKLEKVDVVFPAVHGPNGEDGAIQGMLQMAGIPFVGEGVLASAVCMDKEFSKYLLCQAGLSVPASEIVYKHDLPVDTTSIIEHLGLPVFVKPCNAGSSIGINRVTELEQLDAAISEAFRYDQKVIIEKSMQPCREINCAVLGNPIKCSVPGEVILNTSFYSYQQKHLGKLTNTIIQGLPNRMAAPIQNLAIKVTKSLKHHSYVQVPADISSDLTQKIQNLSITAFKALGCHMMARVDFFLNDQEKLYVNEINTLPAFNTFSIYPSLWQASGLTQQQLVAGLIEQALVRFKTQQSLCLLAPG